MAPPSWLHKTEEEKTTEETTPWRSPDRRSGDTMLLKPGLVSNVWLKQAKQLGQQSALRLVQLEEILREQLLRGLASNKSKQ